MDGSVGPDSPVEVPVEQQVHSQPTTEVASLKEGIEYRHPDEILNTIRSKEQQHKEPQSEALPSSYKSWKKFKCRHLTNSEDTSINPDLHKLIDVQKKYYHLIQFWLPDIQPAFISTRIIRDSRSVERHFARFFKRFMQADDLSEFFLNYRHNLEEDKARRKLKDQEPKIGEHYKQKDTEMAKEPPRLQRKKAPSNRPVKFRGVSQEKRKKQKKGGPGGGGGGGSKGVGSKAKKRSFLPAHLVPDRDLLGTNRAYTGGGSVSPIQPNGPIQERLKTEPTLADAGVTRVLPSPEDMIADIRRLSDRFSNFTHDFINKVYNTHYADFNTAFVSLEAYEKDQETNKISNEGSQDEDNNDCEREADVDFADAEYESDDDDEWEEDDDEGSHHGRVDEQFTAPPSFYLSEQQLYERNYGEEREMVTTKVLGPATDEKSDYDTKHDPNNPVTYNVDIDEEPELGTLIQLFGNTHEIDFYRYILTTYNNLADCVDCLTFVNSATLELNATSQLSNPTPPRVNTENEFLILQAMCPDMSETLIREVMAISDNVVDAATELLDMSAEETAVSALVNVTNNSTPDTVTAFAQDHTDLPPQTVYATNRVLKMKEPPHLQKRVSNSTLSASSDSLVALFNRLTKSSAEYRRELDDLEKERSNLLNTGTRVQLARNRNVTHKSVIMCGIAAYYQEKNRHYQNKLHNARLNVALVEIQRQMSENGNILDLHHFHVREALVVVPAYIDHWYRTQTQNSCKYLYFWPTLLSFTIPNR
ncbi:hypothetical protein BKA69DRAFT_1074509 [Paraphysoderma sedebokerense]|nr:hypothetical protein BKA69DRAFT_1074509 [Paraphysoderma sedebokerense]